MSMLQCYSSVLMPMDRVDSGAWSQSLYLTRPITQSRTHSVDGLQPSIQQFHHSLTSLLTSLFTNPGVLNLAVILTAARVCTLYLHIRIRFEPFLRAMRREKEGTGSAPEPPDGSSADLQSLKEGDEVLAFYAPEGLWYPATLNGIYDLPNNSIYYSVIFSGYSEVETVYPDSLSALLPNVYCSTVDYIERTEIALAIDGITVTPQQSLIEFNG